MAHAQTVITDASNQTISADMRALDVHIGGRVKTETLPKPMPSGSKRITHQWPGTYFEAAFQGDSFILKFDDQENIYQLLIDNLPGIKFQRPGKVEINITKLKNGSHRLRLEKLTENSVNAASFDGFYVPRDAKKLTTKPKSRQIEFIGDSGMAGYGIESTTRQCSKDEVWRRTNTQLAYPALVAKHFNADYQINAISGRGMVRNYDGTTPDVPMSVVYKYAIPELNLVADDRYWNPQITVILLGANDFSTPLKPDEKWRDLDNLIINYTTVYNRFLHELRDRKPNTNLLILWPDFRIENNADSLRMVEQAKSSISRTATALRFKSVIFQTMPNFAAENTGCDYHSSIGDHQKLTNWLVGYLETRSELWRN
jgi:lysophospholipase L1-like esterase